MSSLLTIGGLISLQIRSWRWKIPDLEEACSHCQIDLYFASFAKEHMCVRAVPPAEAEWATARIKDLDRVMILIALLLRKTIHQEAGAVSLTMVFGCSTCRAVLLILALHKSAFNVSACVLWKKKAWRKRRARRCAVRKREWKRERMVWMEWERDAKYQGSFIEHSSPTW
jgi:hypothetical protein